MKEAKRDEVVRYMNEYLAVYAFEDYGPQGLQYLGNPNVSKIVTAVSVTSEVIIRAATIGAEMLLVHHGLFWNNEPRSLDVRMHNRMAALEVADLNLCAYHLALDAHPEIGNNILAVQGMGVTDPELFEKIGWGGKVDPDSNVIGKIGEMYPGAPIHFFTYGTQDIRKVCAITGGAPQYIHQAKKEGYDLFLTGEAAEPTQALAKELGINFIAAGHHATEKAGIRALGEHVAQQFDLKHEFLDTENPV